MSSAHVNIILICPIKAHFMSISLFNISCITLRHDPDIILGWEIEHQSWGYLFQRAAYHSINLQSKLSRLSIEAGNRDTATEDKDVDTGAQFVSKIKIPGRIVLDLWRILRHEVCHIKMFQLWYQMNKHANHHDPVS